MISISEFTLSNKEYITLMDESKDVRETEFKVYIPRLMPNIDNSGSAKEDSKTLDKGRLANSNFKLNSSIKMANYVVAKSAMYFRTNYKGNVKEGDMEKSKGVTETETPSLAATNHGKDSTGKAPSTYTNTDTAMSSLTLSPFPISEDMAPTGMISPHNLEHVHKIIKPHEFTEMVYEDLDRFTIKKGQEMIGEFVGDSVNDLWVSFIPGILPKL